MGPEVATKKHRIGEMLIEGGLITQEDLDNALKIQNTSQERIVNILISQGALDSREFVEFLAKPGEYQTVDLANFDIPPEIIALVPRNFALLNEVVPVDQSGDMLTLAMMCPLDSKAIEALEEHTGMKIKPLLCSSEDVTASLKRHYEEAALADGSTNTLEGPLKLTTAVTMLRHIDSLPALPGTVNRVRELLFDDDSSTAKVAEVISCDPALVAKVLKVANSAAYGFVHRVDNVKLAVSLLGMLETYSVVVSSAVIDVFDKSTAFDYKRFWYEAVISASMMNALAKTVNLSRRTGVFSAGLLHDLGRVALMQVTPRHYARVDQSLNGAALIESEENLIGLTHTEAGHQLAEHWGLPEELCECIRFHHTPQFATHEYQTMVAMANVAGAVARSHGVDGDHGETGPMDFDACTEGMSILGIGAEEVLEAFENVPPPDPADSLWA